MFKSRKYEEEHPNKHDDSHLACDYTSDSDEDDDSGDEERAPTRKRAYATLRCIVVHEMYPGGPKRTFLEGDWFTEYRTRSPCPIAGTPLLQTDPEQMNDFNFQAKFIFLEN